MRERGYTGSPYSPTGGSCDPPRQSPPRCRPPAASPPPRPLPPAPWPLQGLTPTSEVLPRLLEAVRALEGSVWALGLEQALETVGMPRVLHRVDCGPGAASLACRPKGGARTKPPNKPLPPVGRYTVTKVVEDAPPLRLTGTTLQ